MLLLIFRWPFTVLACVLLLLRLSFWYIWLAICLLLLATVLLSLASYFPTSASFSFTISVLAFTANFKKVLHTTFFPDNAISLVVIVGLVSPCFIVICFNLFFFCIYICSVLLGTKQQSSSSSSHRPGLVFARIFWWHQLPGLASLSTLWHRLYFLREGWTEKQLWGTCVSEPVIWALLILSRICFSLKMFQPSFSFATISKILTLCFFH